MIRFIIVDGTLCYISANQIEGVYSLSENDWCKIHLRSGKEIKVQGSMEFVSDRINAMLRRGKLY